MEYIKKPNILLVNAAIHNLGDHAIQIIVSNFLDKKGFFVQCFSMGKSDGYFEDVCRRSREIEQVLISGKLSKLRYAFPFIQHLCLKSYHAIIMIGGGYLNDVTSSDTYLLNYAYIAREARRAGIPYFIMGQSIGPFMKSKNEQIVHNILKRASFITVREHYSKELLDRWYIRSQLTGDDVLLQDAQMSEQMDNGYIVVNLKGFEDFEAYNQNLMHQLIEVLPRLKRKIYVVPFCRNPQSIDYKTNVKFFSLLKLNCNAELFIPENLESFERLILGAGVVISNAFHAVVFACANNTPILTGYVGSYYQQKISGVLELFNYEGAIIKAGDRELLYKQIFQTMHTCNFSQSPQRAVKDSWNRIVDTLMDGTDTT